MKSRYTSIFTVLKFSKLSFKMNVIYSESFFQSQNIWLGNGNGEARAILYYESNRSGCVLCPMSSIVMVFRNKFIVLVCYTIHGNVVYYFFQYFVWPTASWITPQNIISLAIWHVILPYKSLSWICIEWIQNLLIWACLTSKHQLFLEISKCLKT